MIQTTVVIKGAQQLSQRLIRMPENVRRSMVRMMHRASLELFGIVQRKLHGEVLKVDTGLLSQSQNRRVSEGPAQVSASVGFNKRTVPYGAIHEFGGKTAPHEIRPRKKKALAFVTARSASTAALSGGDPRIVVKSVQHPGSVMPERSFLRSSLREYAPTARERITQAVQEGIAK